MGNAARWRESASLNPLEKCHDRLVDPLTLPAARRLAESLVTAATAGAPIIYGKDVLDWWYDEGSSEPSRAKVAWKGENDLAKRQEKKIRLYLISWENPKSDKKVKTIDFSSTKQSPASPFCVAMTVEYKSVPR